MLEDAIERFVKNEGITSEFMEICKWLTDEIQVFSGIKEYVTGRKVHLLVSYLIYLIKAFLEKGR